MKPKEFELKVIKVIKTLRKMKDEKHLPFAKALGMTECNYSKIEKGDTAISIERLKILSEYFKISYHQILTLAEGPDLIDFKYNPFSKILVEYALILEARGENTVFTKEELEDLISKIKNHYK